MSKKAEEIQPNYAPVYAAMYPKLAKVFQKHGYALAVHGSLAKDFDLIAIPWVEEPTDSEKVIEDITKQFAIRQIGKPFGKPFGRLAYSLSITFGDCQLDLSFFPFWKEQALSVN